MRASEAEEEGRKEGVPNAKHDQDARHGNSPVTSDLPPSLLRVKVSVSTLLRASDGQVQDYHTQ